MAGVHATASEKKGGDCGGDCAGRGGHGRHGPDSAVPDGGGDVRARGGNGRTARRLVFWKEVLSDERELRGWTGFGPHAFAIVWASFAGGWEKTGRAETDGMRAHAEKRRGRRGPVPRADAEADGENNVPPVRDDPARGSSPGNRCRPDPAYILPLAPIRKYHGEGEWRLGSLFGIDQATSSGYVRLADRVLAGILPAPGKLPEAVRGVDSPEAFAALFPEGAGDTTVVIDGTHVRFVRPLRRGERDPMYSNKKKYPGGNTVVITSVDGPILAVGRTYAGRAHDLTITREFLKALGRFGEMLQGLLPDREGAADREGAVAEIMKKLSKSSRERIRVLADSGFQGIQKDLPGADVFIPFKRPRNEKLTGSQKEYNTSTWKCATSNQDRRSRTDVRRRYKSPPRQSSMQVPSGSFPSDPPPSWRALRPTYYT